MKQHQKIKNHNKLNCNVNYVNTKICVNFTNWICFDVSGIKNPNNTQKQDLQLWNIWSPVGKKNDLASLVLGGDYCFYYLFD